MTTALLIQPDGSTELHTTHDPLDFYRNTVVRETSVLTANHPTLDTHAFVLVYDDIGLLREARQPLNRKAWALYGRSPVYGPVLFYRDDRADLETHVIEWVCSDRLLSPELVTAMDAWLDSHTDFPR